MALFAKLLESPLVQSLAAALSTPIGISTGSESLGDLAVNPLYLLPIAGVLAFCFLIYAFGFKQTASEPPTLHLFVEESDRKSRKDKKKLEKKAQSKTANGQANGHAAQLKSSPPKPAAVKQPSKQQKAAITAKSLAEPIKRVERKAEKPAKRAKDLRVTEPADAGGDDVNAGDWVQVTRKEKKERNPSSKDENTHMEASPTSKKNKKNVAKSTETRDADSPAKSLVIENVTNSTTDDNKENLKQPQQIPQLISAAQLKEMVLGKAKLDVEAEPVAEDPEQYAVNPSKLPSKKALKSSQQLKNRRISESDKAPPASPPAPVVVESPTFELPVAPAKPVDKITAEIVASYDATSAKPATSKKPKKKKAPAAAVSTDSAESTAALVVVAPPASETAKAKTQAVSAPSSGGGNKTKSSAGSAGAKARTAEPTVKNIPAPPQPQKSAEVSEVTDADSSEGEFKVVKKRSKARRE